uniref:Uncharacterized protein n=1 Tax=Anguilla anguilla TaxID=7936 RepID=A0A0E9X6C0_ANGAN
MSKKDWEPINQKDWFREASHTLRVVTLRPNVFLQFGPELKKKKLKNPIGSLQLI